MNIPGFDAESSLVPSIGSYRATAGFGASGAVDGLSIQSAAMASAFGLRLGNVTLRPIRCCRWVPAYHRFVCTERLVSPFDQCTCNDGVFGPVITCLPPILSDRTY